MFPSDIHQSLENRVGAEQVWIRIVMKTLGYFASMSIEDANWTVPVINVLYSGYHGRWQLNEHLNECSAELLKMAANVGRDRHLVDSIVQFQINYLQDRPGCPLVQESPTIAELDDWYLSCQEILAAAGSKW